MVVRPDVVMGNHRAAQPTGAPRRTDPVGLPVADTATVAVTGNVKSATVVLLAVPLHAPARPAVAGHAGQGGP